MAGRAREGPLAGAFQIDVVLMRHLQKRQSDRRVHLVPGTVRVYEGDLRHMDQQTPYPLDNPAAFYPRSGPGARRTEARRVGKGWFSTCIYWWSPSHVKKKKRNT